MKFIQLLIFITKLTVTLFFDALTHSLSLIFLSCQIWLVLWFLALIIVSNQFTHKKSFVKKSKLTTTRESEKNQRQLLVNQQKIFWQQQLLFFPLNRDVLLNLSKIEKYLNNPLAKTYLNLAIYLDPRSILKQ